MHYHFGVKVGDLYPSLGVLRYARGFPRVENGLRAWNAGVSPQAICLGGEQVRPTNWWSFVNLSLRCFAHTTRCWPRPCVSEVVLTWGPQYGLRILGADKSSIADPEILCVGQMSAIRTLTSIRSCGREPRDAELTLVVRARSSAVIRSCPRKNGNAVRLFGICTCCFHGRTSVNSQTSVTRVLHAFRAVFIL